jgi:hypothetical protein
MAAAPQALRRADLVGEWLDTSDGDQEAWASRTVLRADGTALYVSGPLDPGLQRFGPEDAWEYVRPPRSAGPEDKWRSTMPGVWRLLDDRHFAVTTLTRGDQDHAPQGYLDEVVWEVVSYEPGKRMTLRVAHSDEKAAGFSLDDSVGSKAPTTKPAPPHRAR